MGGIYTCTVNTSDKTKERWIDAKSADANADQVFTQYNATKGQMK